MTTANTPTATTPAILSTDPIDFALDPTTGDLVIEGGKLQLIAGLPAVLQGVRRRIRRVMGEWFADLDKGVPWLANASVTSAQAILGGPFDAAKIDAAIRAAILDAPAVTAVRSLTIAPDRATRTVSVSFVAVVTFADVPTDQLVSDTVALAV